MQVLEVKLIILSTERFSLRTVYRSVQVPFNTGTWNEIKNPKHWTFFAEDGSLFYTGSV